MNIYIDKENLVSLLKSKNRDYYEDCCRLLKRQMHIVFGFEQSELESWDDSLKALFKDINDGRSFKEEYDIYDSNYLENEQINSPFWVFLLNEPHSKECRFDNRQIGRIGKEIPTIKSMFCGKDYDLHQLYDIQDQKMFPSWQKLYDDDHALPCTDILFYDRYFFDNQDDFVNYNFFNIIEVLTKDNDSVCNIVIFTLHKQSSQWGKKVNEFKSHFRKGSNDRVFITVVAAPPKEKNEKDEDKLQIPHDRTILTNYRLFRSGDSFIYFHPKNFTVVTQGKSLDVDSLAKQETQVFANSFVNDMQELYKTIKDKIKYRLYKDIYIVGDKKSNLINFI